MIDVAEHDAVLVRPQARVQPSTFVSPGRQLADIPMVPMPYGDDDRAHDAALRAVQQVDAGGDERTRAAASVMRAWMFFAVSTIATASLTLILLWALGAPWHWILAALGVSACMTLWHVGINQAMERKYTPAGVERAKIAAAERIHRDRLEARQAMHAAAVDAWTTVLVEYLREGDDR